MATATTDGLLPYLRRALIRHARSALTDGQLLDHFLAHRDESAFALLLLRHGPMVFGVCRRVLGQVQDAEDAFQATFLVLARKAESIRPREQVGNWLYGVARRTALKAKTQAARRARREREAARPEAFEEAMPSELRAVLDRELDRLPEAYRTALILCDLEGKSQQEAAAQLGWPTGTLSGRLSKARALLSRRLARHGLALSAGWLALTAAVPPALAAETVQAALSLVAASPRVILLIQGVLHVMLLERVKNLALVLLTVLGLALGGATAWTCHALAQKPADKPVKDPLPPGQTEVRGIIQAVEGQTVTLGTKGATPAVYKLGTDTRVLLDDGTGNPETATAGKVTDLQAGQNVILRVGQDKKVVSVRAEGPTVHAVLKSVDPAKDSITVSGQARKGEPDEDRTLALAKGAKVTISDGKGTKPQPGTHKLGDLPAGVAVTLKLSADGKTVGAVWAEGLTLRGTVLSVDAAAGTIKLQVAAKGKEAGEQTVRLGKDAPVTLGGGDKKAPPTAIKLADVPTGAVATVRLSLDGKEAVSVAIEGATVQGTLQAADAGKGTITVVSRAGKVDPEQTETYAVGKDATLTVDGRAVKLADVPTGAVVSVRLSPDRKQAVSLTAEGQTVRGTVKSLDASTRALTVSVGKEGEKSYTLAKEVQITTTGKGAAPLKPADVKPEREVVLQLSADGKEVRRITVLGE
jgi:RNA polymerase sigma factor (sigma-70 family)